MDSLTIYGIAAAIPKLRHYHVLNLSLVCSDLGSVIRKHLLENCVWSGYEDVKLEARNMKISKKTNILSVSTANRF